MQATTREGIPHLFAPGNTMQMDPLQFMDIIDWLTTQKAHSIGIDNAEFSEKVDGSGIRFGLDVDGKFFIESSRSGPIFTAKAFSDYAIQKTGSTNNIAKGYDDVFDELNNNAEIIKILKKYNKNGIKVIGEVMLNQFGVKHETEDDLIRFVATWYRISKLGNFASFILFGVQDSEGNPYPEAQKIISELKKISNDNIKFDDPSVTINKSISFSKEITAIKKLVSDFEAKYSKDLKTILTDKTKTKDAVTIRKEIKAEIEKFQGMFSKSLASLLSIGKFGPTYEGLVVKLSNDIMFKITTAEFKDMKAALKTMKPLKESFVNNFKSFYYTEF